MTTTTTIAATTARLSSDHPPLRVVSKHTPVPFLLEAFPLPPSHIPPSPAISPTSTNPPLSQPPTAPLPPVPANPQLTERDTLLLIQNRRRSSSIRSVSSSNTDPHSPTTRTRVRNGSISSLRSFHSATLARNPSYDLTHTISEEGPYLVQPPLCPVPLSASSSSLSVTTTFRDIPDSLKPSFPLLSANDSIACIDISDINALKSDHEGDDPLSSFPYPPSSPKSLPLKIPRKSSRASEHPISFPRERPGSPDVSAIIHATPRPRSRPRSRVSSQSRPRITSLTRQQSRPKVNTLKNRASGSLNQVGRELEVEVEEEDGRDSDSSIDLHTPLPHLMLRHGLLSPHSKLLPTIPSDPGRLSIVSNLSQASLQSHFSTFSNLSDASLVTNNSTGSKHPRDSRDTPSRRVRHRDGRLLRGGIGLTTGLGWSDSEDEDAPSPLTRRLSALSLSRRSSATSISTTHSHSSLRSPHPLSRSISHSVLREEEGENDLGFDEFGRAVRSGLSTIGSKSLHVGGSRSLPLNKSTSKTCAVKDDTGGGVQLEDERARDGVTPTRAAFRDSDGSNSSGVGTGAGNGNDSRGRRTHPHTPSTASTSSLSLPFPATPESPNPLSSVPTTCPDPLSIPSRSTTPSLCNIDKSLPPLPLTPRKYPPSLSRLRTYSNTSSVGLGDLGSMSVIQGGSAGDGVGAGMGMPRPSLGSIPRPSLGGVPRPSLSGVPRPSVNGSRPSFSTPRPSISTRPTGSIPLHHHPSASNSSLSTPNLSISSLAAQNSHGNGNGNEQVSSVPFVNSRNSNGTLSPMSRPLKLLQPGEQPQRIGGVLMYNRNVHDQLKRTQSQPQPQSPVAATQTFVMPGSVGEKPKPRTGTGMVYRSSSGPAVSRMRVPSAVRPSGVGVAL